MKLVKVEKKPEWKCPKCGHDIPLVVWGQGWTWDFPVHPCENCGYDGELDTITGNDPDGSVYQEIREEQDEDVA